MGYIENNLMHNEEVLYTGKIHWFIYLPAIFLLVVAIVIILNAQSHRMLTLLGGFFAILSIYRFIQAFIFKISTELAVTNKRVIAKIGFIRRNTIELNHSKVEGYSVDQGILGRIFDFGTLIISGTGGGKTPIPNIDSPLEFRRKAMEAIDSSQTLS